VQLHDELLALTSALSEDGVDYALVGGLAVAVWGAPRATKDIDLLVLPEDVERAKVTAGRCGFILPAEPMEFRDGMILHRVSKVRGTALLMVDLLLVNATLRPHWERRQQRVLGTSSFWVIGREGLIAMKVAAGRPQDQADVVRLLDLDR
jgi:hypothetical protein